MEFSIELEGPIKWIEAINQEFHEQTTTKSIATVDRDTILDDDDDTDEFSYHFPLLNKLIFRNLHAAAIYLKEMNIADSKISLKTCQKHFRNSMGDHQGVYPAVKYMWKSLMWILSILEKMDQNDAVVKFSRSQVTSKILTSKWNNLLQCKKSLATIECFKASVCLRMGAPINYILERFRNIIKLDPEYFLWHHYFYRILRHQRISAVDFHSADSLPQKEEQEACAKAYSHRSSVFLNIFWKAICLKESLWNKSSDSRETDEKNAKWTRKNKKDFKMCLDLLRDALEVARLTGRKDWEETIELERAHILRKLKYQDRQLVEQGRDLLLNVCPTKFPDSSKVHHQVAKYHLVRAFFLYDALEKAQEKAKEGFLAAIKKDPTNFSLLKEYLDFLNFSIKSLQADYIQLFEMINQALEIGVRNVEQQAELEVMRGCITWLYNPEGCKRLQHHENALKIWIDVGKRFPESKEMLLKYIKDPPFAKYNQNGLKVCSKIHHFYLVLQLAEERDEIEENEECRDEETLKVIFYLWVLGDMELPPPPPEPVEIEIAEKSMEREQRRRYLIPQKNTGDGFAVARSRTQSVSDLDNNWRK